MFQSRKEDFVFNAKIMLDSVEVEKDVLCRVYLPVKVTDSLELHFYPTLEQVKRLTEPYFLWQYSVTGEINDFSGEDTMKFSAREVLSTGVTTEFHGPDISESKMIGKPVDLTITHYLNGKNDAQNQRKVTGNFWITDNQLLASAAAITHSYTGNVEVKTIWKFDFELDDKTQLHFEEHYRYHKNDEEDTVSFHELVASFSLEDTTADSPRILETYNKLDDVLLLASFAARQWCVCLGWDVSDSNIYIKQYVRNRTIPGKSDSKRARKQDVLIEKSDVAKFMDIAYSTFLSAIPNDALRLAISFTIHTKDSTLESEFVTLYSALEMLVLQFRREKGLEFVFSGKDNEQKKQWNKIRKGLKQYIEQFDLPDKDSYKKQHIKDKLSELNRISFATAFEHFCNYYSVSLQDLWQVTNNESGISLSTIRNKLVHGDHFSHEQHRALIFAQVHLRWTVERMILAVLGWDVEKSTVSSWFLADWVAYKEWKAEQFSLS
jgi:hypothetical protein